MGGESDDLSMSRPEMTTYGTTHPAMPLNVIKGIVFPSAAVSHRYSSHLGGAQGLNVLKMRLHPRAVPSIKPTTAATRHKIDAPSK